MKSLNQKLVLSNEELKAIEEEKKEVETVMIGLTEEKEGFTEKITVLTK